MDCSSKPNQNAIPRPPGQSTLKSSPFTSSVAQSQEITHTSNSVDSSSNSFQNTLHAQFKHANTGSKEIKRPVKLSSSSSKYEIFSDEKQLDNRHNKKKSKAGIIHLKKKQQGVKSDE